jgi:hypothetical protein
MAAGFKPLQAKASGKVVLMSQEHVKSVPASRDGFHMGAPEKQGFRRRRAGRRRVR